MPSQLQWKPGYKGMFACLHARTLLEPPSAHLPNPGFCAFLGGKINMDVGIEVVLGRGLC